MTRTAYSLLQSFLSLNLKLVSELPKMDAETLDPFVHFCFLTNHTEPICFSSLFVSLSGTLGRMANQSIEAASPGFCPKNSISRFSPEKMLPLQTLVTSSRLSPPLLIGHKLGIDMTTHWAQLRC